MPGSRGRRAVVTGASSGLGAEVARRLAHLGWDLVITARRTDRLEELASELREAHGVDVECVTLDLSRPGAAAQLVEQAYADGGDVDMLVNNAGFGLHTEFADTPLDGITNIMQLNMRALVELTHMVVERMRGRDRRGYIGNISSMTAYFAVPQLAVYAATKAFVRSFTEALAGELSGSNVSATCICLGATFTEFNAVAGIREGALYKPFMMSARRAARISVRGILWRRRNVLPGVTNPLIAFFTWLFPRRMMSWIIKVLMGRPSKTAAAKRKRAAAQLSNGETNRKSAAGE